MLNRSTISTLSQGIKYTHSTMADHTLPMPNLHPDASLNPHSPLTPKSPTVNRLSLSNTPSASPKLVATPISPVHSITTELDHSPVVSPRSSAVPESLLTASRNCNINRLDASDSEDEAARKSVSDFSDYPDGSDVGIKSPNPMFGRGMMGNGPKDSPAEGLFLDTAGSGTFPVSAGLMTNGSTTAIKSRRESASELGTNAPGQRKVSSDSRISDIKEIAAVVPPIVPEALGDSPTLGSFPMTMMIEPSKASPTKNMARSWSTKVQRSPSPIENEVTTTSPDTHARRVPFFTKLRRLTGERRDIEENRKSTEIKKGNQPEPKEEPKSCFNPDSSDDDEGESPVVVHAKQASISRPAVVDHSPSRQSKGFMEALRGRQRTIAENNPGPSRAKAARFLGEDVSVVEGNYAKRAGIVGTPLATEADAQDNKGSFGSGRRSDIWRHPIPNFADGLRSHPVQPPIPEKSSRRKVSFPLPPLVELKPEHRFLRQSIVSTPYPEDSPASKEGGEQSSSSGQAPPGNAKPKTVLTLVLYSHGNRAPRIKKVVVPDPQECTLVNSNEKGPQYRATPKLDFDDEKLFKLIRTEYASMFGYIRTIVSARSVYSLKLISYTALSQLAARHAGPVFRWTLMGQDGTFAEQELLDLYKKPRLGRSKHNWTEWIKGRSSNPEEQSTQADGEKLAVEFTEGWCLSKITIAIATVLLLSLAATLLWTFGGHKITIESVIGPKGAFKESEIELEGKAGDRLGAGVALGVVVLMFGWTGIGGWMLLSWVGM